MSTQFCPDCGIQYFDAEDFCSECGSPLQKYTMDEDSVGNVAASEADSVGDAEHEASNQSPKETLDELLRKKNAGVSAKPDPVVETADHTHNSPYDEILPPYEREQGWRIQGEFFNSSKGYEQWRVSKMTVNGKVHAVFRRFTLKALTTQQTYEAVLMATPHVQPMLARLYSYGTVAMGGGSYAAYEIVAIPSGQPLQVWLREKGTPGADPARYLAPLLAGLLKHMQDIGVRPITLEPSMLWISADHVLTLGVLGALAMRSEVAGAGFCADLANSALLTLPYAAPELIGRRVIGDTTETFAVGQILSEALFDEAQDHAFISDGSVPFAAIGDNVLEAVLMGTLWPKPDERWSVNQLSAALLTVPAVLSMRPPWESLRPGAAKAAFTLGGKDYFLAEALLDAVAMHWDEAARHCGEILNWLEKTRFRGPVRGLQQMMRDGRSADWVLVRLRRLIVPEAPLVWRGYSFSDADAGYSLIQLAQRALIEGEDALQAQQDLERLFAADLRGAFMTNENFSCTENSL